MEIDLKLCNEYHMLEKLTDDELRIISKKRYNKQFTYKARMAQNILLHRWEEVHYTTNDKYNYDESEEMF